MYFSDDIKCAGCAQYLLLPFLTLTTLCRRNTFGLVASPGPIKLHRICFLRLPALLHCLLLSISEMLYSGQNSLSLSLSLSPSVAAILSAHPGDVVVMWTESDGVESFFRGTAAFEMCALSQAQDSIWSTFSLSVCDCCYCYFCYCSRHQAFLPIKRNH